MSVTANMVVVTAKGGASVYLALSNYISTSGLIVLNSFLTSIK